MLLMRILLRLLTAIGIERAYRLLRGLFKRARDPYRYYKKHPIKLPSGTWAERLWSTLVKVFMVKEVGDAMAGILGHGMGFGLLGIMKVWPEHGADLIAFASQQVADFNPLTVSLAGETLRQITGLNVDPEKLRAIAGQRPGREFVIDIGTQFLPVVESVFDIAAAKADQTSRTKYEGARDNIRAFFGTNLTFQLRSLTIGAVASLTGFGILKHLEGLHQTINWAFGFGWLSWSVMSAIMDVTTVRRLKAYYLAQVKPEDFSEGETYQAHIEGRISPTLFSQVLDNLGVRDDVRPVVQAMKEREFDEQDVTLFFQQGWMTEANVKQWARWHGFMDERATLKTRQIVNKRLLDTIDKLNQTAQDLYRDCVIGADKLRVQLKASHYSDNEINAVIALEELNRRKRKWLSGTDTKNAVATGLLSLGEAHDMLICQGLTEEDAVLTILNWFLSLLPPECLKAIEVVNMSPGLIALIEHLIFTGGGLSIPSLIKIIQCFKKFPITIPTEEVTHKAGPKPPSGSFAVVPSIITAGDQTRMSWNIDGADQGKITINGETGLPAEGVRFISPTGNTIYTLDAEGPGGMNRLLASVLVHAKKAETPKGAGPKPTASLTISPARANIGDLVEVRWSSSNATAGLLDTGSGAQHVSEQGALIWVAEKNVVMTFTATGPGGSRSASDSLIVHPASTAAAAARVPTASLSVSPARAHPGDLVEVRWSTSNADHVTLNTGSGAQAVGATGTLVLPAELTAVMSLTATGPGGSRTTSDALIVVPAPADPLPEAPSPVLDLAIRPARGPVGTKYAIEWRARNATHVTLQRGPEVIVVSPIESRIIEAVTSDIWVLIAYGPGGSSVASRAFIVG